MGGAAPGRRAEDRPPAPGLHRPRLPRLPADGGPGLTRSPTRPRVLLLLPTNTYRARDFLEAAQRLGVEAVVGSDQRQALEGVAPGRTLALDLAHPETAAGQIARFAATRPLRAVIPTDDDSAIVAAAASARLGLPHNPPASALAAARKDVLRRLLGVAAARPRGRGGRDPGPAPFRTPAFRLFRADADPGDAAGETARSPGYPCVLKPTFLAASRGVIRADDPARFVAAFRRIAALLARPDVAGRGGEEARTILVEEYVPGDEVALEGLLVRGRLRVLAIFDKPDPLEGPYFEETIYVTPSRHPPAAQRAIAAATAAAARAIGLRDGPVHAELRLPPPTAQVAKSAAPARAAAAPPQSAPAAPVPAATVPAVIEVAARSIGGLCSRTLRFGTGLSLEEVLLMHAIGRDIRRLRRESCPAGVMMIPIPRAGVLRQVRGLEAARSVPGIVEATITATLGQPLVPLPEGHAYLGFLFARADRILPRGPGRAAAPGATEVEAALRAAHRLLEFVIEP